MAKPWKNDGKTLLLGLKKRPHFRCSTTKGSDASSVLSRPGRSTRRLVRLMASMTDRMNQPMEMASEGSRSPAIAPYVPQTIDFPT